MLGLVIAGEAVDAGFDEDEAEFRVLVLAVGLEVFTDRNGLFYEVPKVFWDFRGEAYHRSSVEQSKDRGKRKEEGKGRGGGKGMGERTLSLENTEDLVTRHEADLGDAVRVTKCDTDLGWGEALSSKLCDVLDDVLRRCLKP